MIGASTAAFAPDDANAEMRKYSITGMVKAMASLITEKLEYGKTGKRKSGEAEIPEYRNTEKLHNFEAARLKWPQGI